MVALHGGCGAAVSYSKPSAIDEHDAHRFGLREIVPSFDKISTPQHLQILGFMVLPFVS